MGEIAVKSIHNVFKEYRKMNLVNPYRFPTVSDFVSTWKTDNLSTGSSTSTQVKLPLVSTGTYNFTVNWGDGNSDTITVWNAAATTHTYSTVGTYTITITGTCIGWVFGNIGDRLKILSVSSWGTGFRLGTSQGGYFYRCTNLNLSSVIDILDLTGTTSLASAFRFCTTLTTINRVNEWNTSGVTNISYIFQYSSNFNQDLTGWNVSNVTTMQGSFFGAVSFNGDITNWNTSKNTNLYLTFADNTAFNRPIGGWDVSKVSTMKQTFQGSGFNQNIGSWNVSNVTDFTNFMTNKTAATFSTANLDAIYNGWSALGGGVKPSISIDFGTAKYTSASSAGRAILTGSPNNWAITDGGI